jgi:hypothetical protein
LIAGIPPSLSRHSRAMALAASYRRFPIWRIKRPCSCARSLRPSRTIFQPYGERRMTAREDHDLALVYEKEKQKGNANRATFAVAGSAKAGITAERHICRLLDFPCSMCALSRARWWTAAFSLDRDSHGCRIPESDYETCVVALERALPPQSSVNVLPRHQVTHNNLAS